MGIIDEPAATCQRCASRRSARGPARCVGRAVVSSPSHGFRERRKDDLAASLADGGLSPVAPKLRPRRLVAGRHALRGVPRSDPHPEHIVDQCRKGPCRPQATAPALLRGAHPVPAVATRAADPRLALLQRQGAPARCVPALPGAGVRRTRGGHAERATARAAPEAALCKGDRSRDGGLDPRVASFHAWASSQAGNSTTRSSVCV